MGYDIYIVCPSCGQCIDNSFNYTSNIWPMLRESGIDIHDWHDRLARSIIPGLKKGLEQLITNSNYFRAMNPENGWGDFDSMLKNFLEPILKAMEENPTALVQVSA